jgi:hypothetical protein
LQRPTLNAQCSTFNFHFVLVVVLLFVFDLPSRFFFEDEDENDAGNCRPTALVARTGEAPADNGNSNRELRAHFRWDAGGSARLRIDRAPQRPSF